MVFIVQGTRNPKLRQTTPIMVLLGEQYVTVALPYADRVSVLEHAHRLGDNPGRFTAEGGASRLSTEPTVM